MVRDCSVGNVSVMQVEQGNGGECTNAEYSQKKAGYVLSLRVDHCVHV